jgi:hypothetical protein
MMGIDSSRGSSTENARMAMWSRDWSVRMKCRLYDRVGTCRLVDLADMYERHHMVAEDCRSASLPDLSLRIGGRSVDLD